MVWPTDVFSVPSGGGYAGRSSGPAWAQNAQAFVPLAISGTQGAGGSSLKDFGGFETILATGETYAMLNGGHAGTYDNSVTKLNLYADSPAWTQVLPPSAAGAVLGDQAYYSDGRPAARHVYTQLKYDTVTGKFFLAGMSGLAPNSATKGNTVAFDPVTKTFDPDGTWPATDGNAGYGFDPTRGCFITNSGQLINLRAKTASYPSAVANSLSLRPNSCRWPLLYYPGRDVFFGLYWGSNWSGSGRELNAPVFKADCSAAIQYATFNNSPAYQQFLADGALPYGWGSGSAQPATLCDACMVYDSINDCFWWYAGSAGVGTATSSSGTWSTVGNLYKVVLNTNLSIDMTLYQISLPAAQNAGINGSMNFIPKLKGFVIMPDAANYPMYLVRTS